MSDENVNMDKLFREKLESFSVQPAPHVWDNLQGQLLAQNRRKRRAYFAWISAAAVVVLAFIAGWYINDNTAGKSVQVAEKEHVINEESNAVEKSVEEILVENEASVLQETEESNPINESIKNNIQTTSLAIAETNFSAQTMLAVDDEKPTETNLNAENIELDQISGKTIRFQSALATSNLAKKTDAVVPSFALSSDELIVSANIANTSRLIEKESSWKMGMNIAPGYSSYVTSHSNSYAQNMNYSSESGNGNIGGGLSVQYKTSKKLRIESGIYYAQSGQKSNNSFELFASKNDLYDYAFDSGNNLQLNVPANGFSNIVTVRDGNLLMNSTAGVIKMKGSKTQGIQINAAPEKINAEYETTLVSNGTLAQVFDFVEIPLYLRYSVLDSKFGIELMGGLNAGFIVGNNAYIDNSYGVQNIGTTQDISTLNFSGTVGIGASYDLGKHISVAVEPRLNYYFNSINDNPDVVFRPYRIGFYTGLYYEF